MARATAFLCVRSYSGKGTATLVVFAVLGSPSVRGAARFVTSARARATAASSAPPLQVYTANCNLTGWILEIWPQFNYSPIRFGNMVTWPVTDTLPTAGNYMFQGLKGGSVRQDLTPHYLGPSRAQTLVKL